MTTATGTSLPARASMALALALMAGCGLWVTDDDACDPGVNRVRWYPDVDGDGFGDPDGASSCEPGLGMVDNAEDCNDQDPSITTAELMGEVPGLTLWYHDADNDGYGDDNDTVLTCDPPAEYSAREGGDCVDDDATNSLVCPWIDVVAGRAWTCGLRSDGTVTCWGDTEAGGYSIDALPHEGVDAIVGGNYVACARVGSAITCTFEDLALDLPDPVGMDANYKWACAWDAVGNWQCDAGVLRDTDPQWPLESPPIGKVRSISLAFRFGCAILTDGSLECWGQEGHPAMETPEGNDWVAVRGGGDVVCALNEVGQVTCWGIDPLGEDFASVPDGSGFTELAGTRRQMCALHESGSVACWGGTDDHGDPPDDGEIFTAISAGGGISELASEEVGHACAVTVDGAIECWGHNEQGQATVPDDDFTLSRLSLRGDASCGLRWDDAVRCWGDAPELVYRPASVVVGGTYAASVTVDGDLLFWAPSGEESIDVTPWTRTTDARIYSSSTTSDEALCTLDGNGLVDCWTSVLNDDAYQGKPDGEGYIDVAPGSLHGCALDSLGAVECWAHELALHRIADAPTDNGYVQISAGALHTCAVHDDGGLTCWGDDDDGGVSEAPTDADFVQVSVHNVASCAVHADGAVSCWGSPDSRVVADTPTDGAFVSVSVAHDMACGLKDDGTVQCWGDDDAISQTAVDALTHIVGLSVGLQGLCAVDAYNQVVCLTPDGEGELEGRMEVAEVGGVDVIAVGRDHTCFTRGERLACYGNDTFGQSSPPSQTAASIVVGESHSCALDGDGTATCWGDDRFSQASPPDESWVQLSAGDDHTCGVTTGGRARCWGVIEPPPDDTFEAVGSGPDFACGLSAGEIRCWGDGAAALGTPPGGAFVALAVGDHHACALDEAGLATCWGDDSNGQVSHAPPYAFQTIAAGAEHTCGIKVDGFVRCWGADLEGQSSPPSPNDDR